MKPNLEKLKEQFRAFQENEGRSLSSKSDTTKLTVSRDKSRPTKFRFLCFPDGDIVKEFHVQYKIDTSPGKDGKVKDNPFLCPKANFGEKCAIREFAQTLYDSGDESQQKQAQKLWPTPRFVFIGLERGKEDDGPKKLEVSKDGCREIMSKLSNTEKYEEDGGFFGDMSLDMDIWTEEKPMNNGNTYWAIKVEPARKPTVLLPKGTTITMDMIQDRLETQQAYDPTQFFRRVNYEHTFQILEKYISGLSNATGHSETERYGAGTTPTTTEVNVSESMLPQSVSKSSKRSKLDEKFAQVKKLEQQPPPDDEDIPF